MSVVLEINRDYPYPVALSFDDAAMDILDWLERCQSAFKYCTPNNNQTSLSFGDPT